MGLNYYNGRVCLNVLGGSLENAKEIYEAAEKYVAVGVLSANYPDVPSAVEDMKKYMDIDTFRNETCQWISEGRQIAECCRTTEELHQWYLDHWMYNR